MKALILIFLMISFSSNAADLAKEFEEQRKSSNPKNSLESELMYELMYYKKMLITEALNAPEYSLFDKYGSKFITNNYIVEFDVDASDSSSNATLDFLGSTFKCKKTSWSNRIGNFRKSMPRIIGIKNGSVYVNLPMPKNSFEQIREFEIDLKKPGHCYVKYGKKVEQCTISKYKDQSVIRTNREKIKIAFDNNLRDCKESYKESTFDQLKFFP